MYEQTAEKIASAAAGKKKLINESWGKYLLASMLAGVYVGFGILLMNAINGFYLDTSFPGLKILNGLSFGIALSLVTMAGSELFTGNNMVMTIGVFEKKVCWKDLIKVWIVSYIGNFLGAFILAFLYSRTGFTDGAAGEAMLNLATLKLNPTFKEIFFRGILCNMLVCLAVLCGIRMESESGKLIMIFWCLFAFVTIGFEHSVANMTIFLTSLLMENNQQLVTLSNMWINLIPSTLGNIVGGAVIIGFTYAFVGKKRE